MGDDLNLACNYCRLIRDRAEESWSKQAVAQLVKYAQTHFDPNLKTYSTPEGHDVNKASISDLEHEALNCVRGAAALAIGAFLWKQPDRISEVGPAIESLINDPHPAVRFAAIETCVPLLNIDKNLAVEYFVKACHGDMRVAASHRSRQMFNYGIKSHYEQLSPIILKMIADKRSEIAEEGAAEVCARWLFYGMFEKELLECQKGSVSHRKGIAKVAAHYLSEEAYKSKCYKLLQPLFDDEESDVRKEANTAFRQKEILTLNGMPEMIIQYVKSKAFSDNSTSLLYILEDHTGSLFPYADVLLSISKVFAGPLAEKSRDISTSMAHDAMLLIPLILRLYEQSQDHKHSQIQNLCLDIWDIMFEKRVGDVKDLMKNVEQ